jgi:tRNA (cytosine34-C5)-methyltransferase
LKRGLELLDVGGLLVYSTCSLNPIEDEAVLSRMLREAGGAVQLLDINLPNLKYVKGLSKWKV